MNNFLDEHQNDCFVSVEKLCDFDVESCRKHQFLIGRADTPQAICDDVYGTNKERATETSA